MLLNNPTVHRIALPSLPNILAPMSITLRLRNLEIEDSWLVGGGEGSHS